MEGASVTLAIASPSVIVNRLTVHVLAAFRLFDILVGPCRDDSIIYTCAAPDVLGCLYSISTEVFGFAFVAILPLRWLTCLRAGEPSAVAHENSIF
jgi:hypothetical protein